MSSPQVSVIMPVYNQADYIAGAIKSIFEQTYTNWELIIINDESTDSTAEVVAQFDDPRIRYIYQANKGASGARNTGIAKSSGKYVTFLDADDMYHADKLKAQVTHLDKKPDIGLSYLSTIVIDQQENALMLEQAPAKTSLDSLLLGWPITMNDFMVRRSWIEEVGGFDESLVINEDRDFFVRLNLGGCQFARVDRFLTYRRLYAGKVLRNPAAKFADSFRVLDRAFTDPRCPADVLALRDMAYANLYLYGAYQASVQLETTLAQEYFREMIRLNPTILDNEAKSLLAFLNHASIREGGEHEAALRSVFAQLPPEMAWLAKHCDWAVAYGYLLRGGRDVMWGRFEEGDAHFMHAVVLRAQLDEHFLRVLSDQLLAYEIAFGAAEAQSVLQNLVPYLNKVGTDADVRWLKGCYSINQAFKSYHAGKYAKVPRMVIRAIANDPKYLANRGAMSALLRSIWRTRLQSKE